MSTATKKAKPIAPTPCWSAMACPFCGWVPSATRYDDGLVEVACNYRGCPAKPVVKGTRSVARTVRRWNRRGVRP
jgi:hypothetical protein